jgi:cyclopropane-fatty-acyl-phospholipid synthase
LLDASNFGLIIIERAVFALFGGLKSGQAMGKAGEGPKGARRRSMDRLLALLLKRFVRRGNLRLTTARGAVFTVGDGASQPVAIRFMTKAAQRGVLLDPEIRLGEAYMDGTLRVEQGSIADLLAIVLGQTADGMPPGWAQPQWFLRYLRRRLQQFNPPTRSQRNVAHHYDLDGRLYSLFLDADQQYSCAYFETPDQSLDDAQIAKKRHLAAKLLLNGDQRVLDIGCGWADLRSSRGILPLARDRLTCPAAMAARKRARH